MTWNIHGSIGTNPRFDLSRVVDLIKKHQPDVIALQEVDSRTRLDDNANPFSVLQRSFWDHGVGAKSIVTEDGGAYGQMLISRWPLNGTEIHDLSFPEREPRRAIKACVETPIGPMEMIATHLGLSVGERRGQANALLKLAGSCKTTTIVMGDFNDWFWAGSVRSVLSRAMEGRTEFRTFPSFLPLLRLDRIYCRPVEALTRAWTDPAARRISDHLPVIAEIRPGIV